MSETVSDLVFSVPLIPPSVNHYKKPDGRSGWFMTPAARAFVDAVCIFSHRQPVSGEFYLIDVTYVLPRASFLSGDVDNFAKLALDALKTAGVIRDDRYVLDLAQHKRVTDENSEARTDYFIRGRAALEMTGEVRL